VVWALFFALPNQKEKRGGGMMPPV